MYCSQCGKELREAAAFCVYCGTPVEPMAMPIRHNTIRRNNKKAIIIVVISVGIAALMFVLMVLALALPAIFAAREAASRMQCGSHLRKIAIALHNYHDTYGALPPLHTVDEEGNPLHSWRVLILPFIEQQHLYSQIRLDEPWDSDHNRQFHDQMPWIFRCPNHPGDPRRDCTYSAIAGWSLVPAQEAGSVLGLRWQDFPQGTSNTLALVEVREAFNWMDPTADVTLEELNRGARVGSYHATRRSVVAYLDGSVRFIDSLSPLQTTEPPDDVEEETTEATEEIEPGI